MVPADEIISASTLARAADARREGVLNADVVEGAAHAANQGRIVAAAATLRPALQGATDLRLLFLGFQFFFRTGEPDEAERLTVRRLELAERDGQAQDVARACTNLGLIHLTTGRRDSARELCRRALEIDEGLGHAEGVARDLGNLANVVEADGDLDRTEMLNRRALAIAETIGAGEIAAGKLANLGDIEMSRGRADEARALWRQAIARFERLGLEKWRREYEARLAMSARAGPGDV
ncbi:MAG TPA: tetratricopeptide repeat protein [Phycisphaerales bacterium]|nr:tetratricopeptide repeat protein [Phycisphaerales bacterium]